METLLTGQGLLNVFRVHCKSSFDNNMRMTYLISTVDSEAKKATEPVDKVAYFMQVL